MRDPKDTDTHDMHPAKRGRPCLDPDAGPMTEAERARRYRRRRTLSAQKANTNASRKIANEALPRYSDVDLIDAIRLAVADAKDFPRGIGRKRAGVLIAELSRRYPVL